MTLRLCKFPRYISVVLFICIICINTITSNRPNFKFGFEMIARTYDAVCWYEALKQFPNTNVAMFRGCSGQAKITLDSTFEDNFEWPIYEEDASKFNDTVIAMRMAFEQSPLINIPTTYAEKCSKYLMVPLENYEINESEALNDGGIDYPYKGFSYCIMNQLRQNHGNGAIDAVKNELTHSKKEWHETFLDRVNEFRVLHNSTQFQLVENLTTSAQQWADKLATECKILASLDVDKMYNGQPCGENVASLWNGLLDDLSTASYLAADTWYEEVQYYPWKTGFKDDDINNVDWDLFGKIKDFTQMVWRNSLAVGYGYSFNATCAEMGMESRFVVARYYPAGNTLGVKGTFKQNVKPAGLLSGVVGLVGGLLGGGKKNQKGKVKQKNAHKHDKNGQNNSNSKDRENENVESGNQNGRRERNEHKRNKWGSKNGKNGPKNKNKRWHKNE